MITLFDIIIIVALILGLNVYFAGRGENIATLSKDGLKITASTDKLEYEEDEIIEFSFVIENKSKEDMELIFYRQGLFNILIEKDNNLVFKRDLIDSLTERGKKIIINREEKKIFTYKWNLESNMAFSMESGRYAATLYSLDLGIEIKIHFVINLGGKND